MSDLIVLGIVLLALSKMPDGELKHYDRNRNTEIATELRAEHCNCNRGCEDLSEDCKIHRKDRSTGKSEL